MRESRIRPFVCCPPGQPGFCRIPRIPTTTTPLGESPMQFNWELFLQSCVIGLSDGALIALIALGYTLVYGIVELINFAHGEVFMMGAFMAATVVGLSGVSSRSPAFEIVGLALLAFAISIVFSAAINWGNDRIAYRRLRNAPRLAPLICAIGFSFILQQVGIYWKGSNSFSPPSLIPSSLQRYNILNEWFHLGTHILRVRPLDLVVVGVTIPLLFLLTWFV